VRGEALWVELAAGKEAVGLVAGWGAAMEGMGMRVRVGMAVETVVGEAAEVVRAAVRAAGLVAADSDM